MKTKKILFLFLSLLLILTSLPTNSFATGNGKVWVTNLPNSGTGGSATRYNTISGTVATQCNGVYNTRHSYSYGAYSLSSFRINTDTLRITAISRGTVTGGVGMTYNTENSSSVAYNSPYYGRVLNQGQNYPTSWNRTIPLGSLNRTAQVTSSTIAGTATNSVCDTEVHQMFQVGRARSLGIEEPMSTLTDSSAFEVPEEIKASSSQISLLLSEEFNSSSPIIAPGTTVNQFSHKKTGENVSVIQQDAPIVIMDIDQWEEKRHGNLIYEIGSYLNTENSPITVVKYETDGIYFGMISTLDEKEMIKVMRKYSKGKLFD